MNDRHRQLKELIQGRGLDALLPGPKPPAAPKPDGEDTFGILSLSKESMGKTTSGETAFRPARTTEDITMNPSLQPIPDAYISIRQPFTSLQGVPQAAFNVGQTIEFNLDVEAGGLLAELKAPFHVELISIDLRTQNPQPLYSFLQRGNWEGAQMRIMFQKQAAVTGAFRLQGLVVIENTKKFGVAEGGNYLVY
ncbi:MAG: hypothetical protein ACREOO_17140 [bacterium]